MLHALSSPVIDGVVVASEMIHDRVKKLKFSKKIWMVLDLD